jgi:predicted HD phosphohydrolase
MSATTSRPTITVSSRLFQGYYYFHHYDGDRHARDRFKDHPHYDACVRFCERWDQRAFDPDYDTLPLETFEPMVRRLFAEPRQKFV